ncbi:DUF5625 family protein [Herbaspirillum sp. alder98]|uniref:DUF5625 family protein n=1 Tax=Herbaspirillum sp. alder98 TaxID=2913096 RepID=UPI001CD900F1|nr:DUF5625 family protein [Herbaspirillum sp. alder98]MCA1325036.1 DUF5625 family protein [Herbaspirillum sp. alder98]
MLLRTWLKRLAILIPTGLSTATISGCTKEERATPGVQESGYVMPFALRQGGEQIDLLVRVRDSDRPYQFNLIFVSHHAWPEEKKNALRRMYQGFAIGDAERTPNPFKLRIRIDSFDEKSDVHIEETISTRKPHYLLEAENKTVTWHGQMLYARKFTPGIYRVRVDNLAAIPQIDFKTLFEFERHSRKY